MIMGLFSSREDKIKKLDEELNDFDEELLYKKALKHVYDGAKLATEAHFDEFLILHHDLQEQNKHLESIEELLRNKK